MATHFLGFLDDPTIATLGVFFLLPSETGSTVELLILCLLFFDLVLPALLPFLSGESTGGNLTACVPVLVPLIVDAFVLLPGQAVA